MQDLTERLQKARRELVRWRILRILEAGRPEPVQETLVLQCLVDAQLTISPGNLRREVDYLRGKGLVEISNEQEPLWMLELTSDGVDVAEGTVVCPPGISTEVPQ